MAKKTMIVSIIAAIGEKNEIGFQNDLIWHLPNDMKYFKEITSHHHIITGRKNYISIPVKYRPLQHRTNIVLTKDTSFCENGCIIKHSLEDAIEYARKNNEKEVFIIGGGQIYAESMHKNLVDKLYITHVHDSFEADTYFPIIDSKLWKLSSIEHYQKDEKHKHNYSFAVYQKIN